jgi:ElaB/YqjD/DUF883 family membrane-anchored ribosome-binding protein
MPNDPKEDEISLEIWCDLLEKELKAARPRNSRDEILPSPTARKAMDEHQNPEEAVESGKDHLRAAAGNLKEAASAKVEEMRHAAEQKAEELRSATQSKARELKGTAESWQAEAHAYIRHNPIKSVLIALGLGVLLGLLFRK